MRAVLKVRSVATWQANGGGDGSQQAEGGRRGFGRMRRHQSHGVRNLADEAERLGVADRVLMGRVSVACHLYTYTTKAEKRCGRIDELVVATAS